MAPAVGALAGICPPGWGGDAGPVPLRWLDWKPARLVAAGSGLLLACLEVLSLADAVRRRPSEGEPPQCPCRRAVPRRSPLSPGPHRSRVWAVRDRKSPAERRI